MCGMKLPMRAQGKNKLLVCKNNFLNINWYIPGFFMNITLIFMKINHTNCNLQAIFPMEIRSCHVNAYCSFPYNLSTSHCILPL